MYCKKISICDMTKYLLLYIIIIINQTALLSQTIWPGDINNNGIVNEVDVLYWGWAYGSRGPARSRTSDKWEAQTINQLWNQQFPDGINYAYADCDGNGKVDKRDLDKAIEDNFGLRHGDLLPDGFKNGSGRDALKLVLETDEQIVAAGSKVKIRLKLDDLAAQTHIFYGIALKLSYTADLIKEDEELDFGLVRSSWVYGTDSKAESLIASSQLKGVDGLAITRTNQIGTSIGTGEIGSFTIVMEDIILYRQDTFRLSIDSVLFFDDQFNSIPVIPDTIQIIVKKDLEEIISSETNVEEKKEIIVFPNPTSEVIYISSEYPIKEMWLFNSFGEKILLSFSRIDEKGGVFQINMPILPFGLYYFSVLTNDGYIFHKKIIIQNDN